MARKGDVVAVIKASFDLEKFDFTTAEGRADFDDLLRVRLDSIEDRTLRRHAGEMVREWRREIWRDQGLGGWASGPVEDDEEKPDPDGRDGRKTKKEKRR